jgi:hypothetical protein
MRETLTDVVQCTSTIVQNVHTSVGENSVVDGGGFSITDVDGVSVPEICAFDSGGISVPDDQVIWGNPPASVGNLCT